MPAVKPPEYDSTRGFGCPARRAATAASRALHVGDHAVGRRLLTHRFADGADAAHHAVDVVEVGESVDRGAGRRRGAPPSRRGCRWRRRSRSGLSRSMSSAALDRRRRVPRRFLDDVAVLGIARQRAQADQPLGRHHREQHLVGAERLRDDAHAAAPRGGRCARRRRSRSRKAADGAGRGRRRGGLHAARRDDRQRCRRTARPPTAATRRAERHWRPKSLSDGAELEHERAPARPRLRPSAA